MRLHWCFIQVQVTAQAADDQRDIYMQEFGPSSEMKEYVLLIDPAFSLPAEIADASDPFAVRSDILDKATLQ